MILVVQVFSREGRVACGLRLDTSAAYRFVRGMPHSSKDSPSVEPSAVTLSRRHFLERCAWLAAATGLPLWSVARQLEAKASADAGLPPSPDLPPSRLWPRWKSLSAYFYDGPILGNGLLGTVIHRGLSERFPTYADAVLFAFNRADLAQPVSPRIPEGADAARFMVGRFALRAAGKVEAIEMELDLSMAELRGTMRTDRGEIHLRAFVHATRPVLVIEQRGTDGEPPREIDFLPAPAGVVRELGRVDDEESATYDLHPPARRHIVDGTHFHEQSIGGGKTFTVAWTQGETAPGVSRFLATLSYSHPVAAEAFDAAAVLRASQMEPIDALVGEHRTWWAAHYGRISISIPDAEAMERFWWLQQYKIGCLFRPYLQLLDLNGPWYCHTPWPAIWWNLNTQMMYRHLAAGNRGELGAPLLRAIEMHSAQLGRNLPHGWGAGGGIAIGRASSFDLDSPVTMLASEDPMREGREAGNMLWALETVWWLLGHEGNETSMRTRLHPLLRSAVKVYEPLLHEEADGFLHLRETFSPEYAAAPDCHYDLALLRWAYRTLSELEPEAGEAARWRTRANQLAPYQIDQRGTYAIGRGVFFDRGHRHFGHLMAIWPIADLDVSTADGAALARRSIEHWLSRGELAGWSHAAAAQMYARLGDGNAAAQELETFLQSLTFTTLYREAGLCLETPFLGLDAVHSLLLQSAPGKLSLLPAIPPRWRSLRVRGLRASGGLTIDLSLAADELRVTLRAGIPYSAAVKLPTAFRWMDDVEPVQSTSRSRTAIIGAGNTVEWVARRT